MAEYYIRRGPPWRNAAETYEVSKFDGRDIPDTIYRVWRDDSGVLQCECPAGVHHVTVCKHRRWVEQWLALDPGTVYVVTTSGPRDDGTFVAFPSKDPFELVEEALDKDRRDAWRA